jgi:hypothetical protein
MTNMNFARNFRSRVGLVVTCASDDRDGGYRYA